MEIAGLNAIYTDSGNEVNGVAERVELALGVGAEHFILVH